MADQSKKINKKIDGKSPTSDSLYSFQEAHSTHMPVQHKNIFSYDQLPADPYDGDPASGDGIGLNNLKIAFYREAESLSAIPNSVIPGTTRARGWKIPHQNLVRPLNNASFLPVVSYFNGTTSTVLNPLEYNFTIDYEGGTLFIENDSDILVNDYNTSEEYRMTYFYFNPNIKNISDDHARLVSGQLPLKLLSSNLPSKYPWGVIQSRRSDDAGQSANTDIMFLIDPDGGAPSGGWSGFTPGNLCYLDSNRSNNGDSTWTEVAPAQYGIYLNLQDGLLWQYTYDSDLAQFVWKEFSLVSDITNKLVVSKKGGNYVSLEDAISNIVIDEGEFGVIECFTNQNFAGGGGGK